MIPAPRIVLLAALGVPLALLGLLGGAGLLAAVGYDVALLVLAAVDAAVAGRPGLVEVRRRLPDGFSQGREAEIVLEVGAPGRGVRRLVLRDVPPPSFEAPVTRLSVTLRPRVRRVRVSYRAVPRERGRHGFGPVVVRRRGPFGLVERQARLGGACEVLVQPELVPLAARGARSLAPAVWAAGLRRARLAGEGREFHQLRDYAAGDDVRLIDWKAAAHRGRLTVREHRPERNQRVLVLLDAGRLMTVRVGDRLRFDWAVQAAGRLARAALAMGDVVGLAVFSSELRSWVAPSRGAGHLGRIARVLRDAEPDLEEPVLGAALGALLRGHPRRTLVVLFTEFDDPGVARGIVRHMGALAPRHLGLTVTLADTDLEAERALRLDRPEAVFRRAAAEELWQESRRIARTLEARGSLVLRARAGALAAETVTRYMTIKREGRL